MGRTHDNAALRLAGVRDAHVARVNNLSHLLDRLRVYVSSTPRSVGDGDEREYGAATPVTINVGGSIGQLNVGETVRNLHTAIAGLGGGADDLRTALDALTAAVGADPDLADTQRAELLENVEFLVSAADAAPEHRKRGVIKAVLAQIGAAAATATQVYTAWQDWGPVIQQHLLR